MHCVTADTWEKAQLAAEEKPHCVLNKKLQSFLIKGACDCFLIWLFFKIKAHTPAGKENKKRLFAGLHPVVMLAVMVAWKQVFRIHDDHPDRTACRTISIKSPPLRCGEKTHCVLEKKPSGWRAGPAVTTQDASSPYKVIQYRVVVRL